MNSLEWRAKKLEEKIIGQTNDLSHVDRILSHHSGQEESILDRLEIIAKQYRNYIDNGVGQNYTKYVDLYEKHKDILKDLGKDDNEAIDNNLDVEHLLAEEDSLKKYMEDTKTMCEKADAVLNIESWPDLSGLTERIKKLQKINQEQHFQSIALDKKTLDLIVLYDEILDSFKKNMELWNQKLESHENIEREIDDEDV